LTEQQQHLTSRCATTLKRSSSKLPEQRRPSAFSASRFHVPTTSLAVIPNQQTAHAFTLTFSAVALIKTYSIS